MVNFLAPAQLRINVVHLDGSAQLLLDGELDLLTAPDLWRSASEVVARLPSRSELVIDLSQLDFLDAAGLGVLVRLRNHLRSKGSALHLDAAPSRVRRVFELTELDGLLRRPREDRSGAASSEEMEMQA
ncbi:MAG: STAS domain-containing protein [Acidimicrobiales bacterium]